MMTSEAMTVLHSVREVLSLPVTCISTGAQPFIGYNYGARAMERVRQGIRFTFCAGGLCTLAAWLSVEAFSGFYVRLFSDNEAILADAPINSNLFHTCNILFFGDKDRKNS